MGPVQKNQSTSTCCNKGATHVIDAISPLDSGYLSKPLANEMKNLADGNQRPAMPAPKSTLQVMEWGSVIALQEPRPTWHSRLYLVELAASRRL